MNCPKLSIVYLDGNNINDDCMDTLCELLVGSKAIKTLSLENNNISDDGIEKLVPNIIKHTELRCLSLSRNGQLTDRSKPFLRELIENVKLTKCNVDYNPDINMEDAKLLLLKNIVLDESSESIDLSES